MLCSHRRKVDLDTLNYNRQALRNTRRILETGAARS